MFKRIISFILMITLVSSVGTNVTFAKVTDEDEIVGEIETVKEVYKPGETYFVSNSTQKWVGEDNIDGDKTLKCFAPGTTNSHGRFGGLWQSMGFANYVFYNIFGEIPQFGYHCNPGELNDKVEVIGRYASKCRYIRGDYEESASEENIKSLLSDAKQGDILVVAPEKKCNTTGKAMIIMNVNDTFITVYHADYKGNCAVTEDVISYDALADFHCVTLLRSTDYPYPEPVPPNPVEKVTVSNNDFSLNENVSVTWPLTKHTKTYKVFLVDENDSPIQQGEFKSSVTSFVFKNAGKYRIKVIANNEYGDSEATYSDEIVVHNQNIVTFKDYDGTVITTQKVEYGKNAVAPNVPQRKGYQFAGWDKSLENIKEPTEITATYEVETYTIKYYDVGGKKALLSESVKYQEKANPPTNYTITEGYVFAGWQISFDSEGTDYNCVNGDMTLIATEKWANLNIPITITVSNPYRAEDGTKYTASLAIKNHDSAAGKNVKILGTLKAADGKALKIVVLHELALKANESVTRDIEIVYSEKATTMEFVAVGMVGNSKTGGAFSKITSTSILDNTSWGSWTDWTAEDKHSSYDAYETKTQYRYRNKTYTTASTSSLSGWTKYDTKRTSWSGTYGPVYSNPANGSRNVWSESYVTSSNYKNVYRYYRYANSTCAYYGSSYPDYKYYYEWEFDYPLELKSGTSYSYKLWCGCGISGGYHTVYSVNWQGHGDYPASKWVSYNYGTRWYYQEPIYTYYYWKWGSWSSWSDTYKSGDETGTRTVYRYRNRSASGDPEDTSGEVFEINGTLNNVETDFSGKIASIMVYKKCNTDPTEEQLEYVGQTTIGEGNTYSFKFKPIDIPSSETGEFIVALGIEGADRLVNVDVIEADVPSYQVKFVVDGVTIDDPNARDITISEGNTVKAQLVKEGETAIAPEPPVKEGYTFVKWSETLTGIKTDKVITAEYEPNEYCLVFIDWDTNEITTQRVKHGDAIVYPDLKEVEGAQTRTWDKKESGVEFATDNMIIGSVSTPKEYTVKFMDGEEVVSTQTVKHGQAATLPEQQPIVEGMLFADWVGDGSYNYIVRDVNFVPSYIYDKTVSMPEANIIRNSDGSSTVELSCDTEGAEIYYVIDSHNKSDEVDMFGIDDCENSIYLMEASEAIVSNAYFKNIAEKYNGDEILLGADETITFIAYADGMNESVPVAESNENEELYLEIFVKSSNIQEYRDSIKGDATFVFDNNSPEYSIGTFTLCFYDQRGILLGLVPQNVDVFPGTNIIEFENVCIDNIDYDKSKTITCKLITWLSGEEVSPLSDFVDVNIK